MKDATRAVTAGRDPKKQHGIVNPPVYHASTILFPTVAELKQSRHIRPGDGLTYGVHGTPTTFAFEEAVAALEGGYRTRLCNSGLQAVTMPLLCCLSAGDHLLMLDSCYGPTRSFCDGMLARLGIETTYYDPLIGGDIRALIRPNTHVVFVESPGSWTFEVQDIPAIAEEAHKTGALVMMDNTWASPLYFKPFEHGVDISIQAATKYLSGHSDLVMGTVTTTEAAYPALQRGWAELGLCGAPDDTNLAMRGMRTIHTRLPRHWQSGLEIGHWLAARNEVAEVLHPAMEHDPGHALWSRDFLGASSLFAFTLAERYSSEAHLAALLDHSEHFGMGFSWGGFESLMIPINPAGLRTVTPWPKPGRAKGQSLRIHVGLEDPGDLIDDLSAGFARMAAV
ncbi:MAG: cystathionine beta-lyase [Pseudomonadota bacterium]